MSAAGAGRRPGLPAPVRPMLATPGELPPPDRDADWGYELKWDGVRAVAYRDGGPLRLLSRNDRDVAAAYPELAGLAGAAGDVTAILDGEIVAFDAGGRTSFGRLQERMHVREASAARRLSRTIPVVYLVFDVLHLDGVSTLELPYRRRRELVDALGLTGPAWQTPPSFTGGGPDVLRASREQGFEGIVAKRLASPYRPGRRSPDWLKIKHVRTQEVVVVGWRPGQGRRAGGIGSLVLAVGGPDGLRHVGGVGTGFTERSLADLMRWLAPHARDTPPRGAFAGAQFRDVHWVEPLLVGEVAFAEWTQDGQLRHPSWRGLRPDKSPDQVVPEC